MFRPWKRRSRRVGPEQSYSGNKEDRKGKWKSTNFCTHMVVPFLLVPKIWLRNKRGNIRLGRVKWNLQEPRYFKQKESKLKRKHKIECHPKYIKSETLGISKNRPKYIKSETSRWKSRNNPSKGNNKNVSVDYYTISERNNSLKG